MQPIQINLGKIPAVFESNSKPDSELSLLKITVISIGFFLIAKKIYNKSQSKKIESYASITPRMTEKQVTEFNKIESYALITPRMTKKQVTEFNKKVARLLKLGPVKQLLPKQIQKFDNELVKREKLYEKSEANKQKAWHRSTLGNYKTLASSKDEQIIRSALKESYSKRKNFSTLGNGFVAQFLRYCQKLCFGH